MGNFESKCFVYRGPGDVVLETWSYNCGPTDIMIKIEVCGRCGTDRRLYESLHPRVKVPTVLGHELVGSVVEVGSEVEGLRKGIGYLEGRNVPDSAIPKVGSRVTVQGRVARHRDGLMLMAEPIQNLSFYIPGAFAQYMKIPAEMIQSGAVLAIPDGVSSEEGALVEPAACALESIFATPHPIGVDDDGRHIYRGSIRSGGRTLVIGSGTLAMIYCELAKREGAAEVWIMVRSERKQKLVRQVLGDWPRIEVVEDYSDDTIENRIAAEASIEERLRELTNGTLFDDVVLAAPSTDAQRLMFQLLNPEGYGVAASFAGLHERSERANVDQIHYRIGKTTGTSGCSTRTMETIIGWLSDGSLSLEGFTSPERFSLNDDPEHFFKTTSDGRKPMLYPWE